MKRHLGKMLLGGGITVFLLWWTLRDVSFLAVWAQLLQGDMGLLLAAVVIMTSGFFIRALRWKVLLMPIKSDTRLRSRFAAVNIGFMANNVLPARVGEFARAYALSRLEPLTASAAFGSLVVERVLDGVVLLLLLAIPPLTPGFPSTGVLSTGFGALILRGGVAFVGAVLVMLLLMTMWPRAFVRVAEYVVSFLPKGTSQPIVDALEAFLGSVAVLRSPALLLLSFAWTLILWLWNGLSFWLGMKAFGIDTGLVSAYFTEAIVAFGVAIPSAPGFVGTFHAAANFALSNVYGVAEPLSLAFAFGYHFGSWLPVTTIGLAYAWWLGLSLGDVNATEAVVEEEIEAHPPEHGSESGTR